MKLTFPVFALLTIGLASPAAAADGSGSGAAGLVSLLILAALYCIPGIIASNRKHLSAPAIWMFNVFLGWTFLGWVLALVWSLTSNTRANAERYSKPSGV